MDKVSVSFSFSPKRKGLGNQFPSPSLLGNYIIIAKCPNFHIYLKHYVETPCISRVNKLLFFRSVVHSIIMKNALKIFWIYDSLNFFFFLLDNCSITKRQENLFDDKRILLFRKFADHSTLGKDRSTVLRYICPLASESENLVFRKDLSYWGSSTVFLLGDNLNYRWNCWGKECNMGS